MKGLQYRSRGHRLRYRSERRGACVL